MRLAYLGLVAAALGCTAMAQDGERDAKAEAALAKELDGLTPGKPQTCLNSFESRDASAQSFGTKLVYRTAGSSRFVNQTTGCTGVGNKGFNILVTNSFSGQLCRGDIARTVDQDSHFTTGGCALGDFVPYTKAK